MRSIRGIPGGVWALGFVSMFSDASSEMIHSLLPVFLVTVLGISATAIGMLEGIAEATVLVVKMFSGTLSDLADAKTISALLLGVALWGLHMGFSQGLLAAMVADTEPNERRGTAFGLFSLMSGIALFAASALAGGLWDRIGASATFYMGAGFAGLSVVGLLFIPRMRRQPDSV